MEPEVLAILLIWLSQPLAPERCPTCDQETGGTPSLTRWPKDTHCPRCGADLVPF